MQIPEMEQKFQKKLFLFQLIAFELQVASYCNTGEDTCNRRSICKQTPLRFHIELWETFPNQLPSEC